MTTEKEFEKRLNDVEERQELEVTSLKGEIKQLNGQKEAMADEIGKLMAEVDFLKSAAEATQGLRDFVRKEIELQKGPGGQSKSLELTHGDLEVSINHEEKKPIEMSTDNHKGQIMFVIVKDIGRDTNAPEIADKMRERGWRIETRTLSRRITDLETEGLLIRVNGNIRPPKLVKIQPQK